MERFCTLWDWEDHRNSDLMMYSFSDGFKYFTELSFQFLLKEAVGRCPHQPGCDRKRLVIR